MDLILCIAVGILWVSVAAWLYLWAKRLDEYNEDLTMEKKELD